MRLDTDGPMVRVYKQFDVWYILYADGHSVGHFYELEDALAWYCGLDMLEGYDDKYRSIKVPYSAGT
jgi:hypothetical protein